MTEGAFPVQEMHQRVKEINKAVERLSELIGGLTDYVDSSAIGGADLTDGIKANVVQYVEKALEHSGATVKMSLSRTVDRRFGENGPISFGPTTLAVVITYDEGAKVNASLGDELKETERREGAFRFRGHWYSRELFRSVDDLDLSVRTANGLESGRIHYIGELVQCADAGLLTNFKGIGRKQLDEIKEKLAERGLHLDMVVPNWQAALAAWGKE